MSVIDVSAWIGSYPFRGIPRSSLEDLRRKMSEPSIERAIVSPYEAIFWENNLDAYEQFASRLSNDASIEVWPVARPAAMHGLEKLLDRFQPRGIRLLPNYHGYRLSDPFLKPVFDLAKERRMIVQIFARIADERWHYLLQVPPVDQNDLDYVTSVHTDQPIILSGLNSLAPFASRLRQNPNLFVDLSRIRGPQFAIEQIVNSLPVEKLLFGSLWPVQIIEATLWQITSAKIEDSIKQRLLAENARSLLALATAGSKRDISTTTSGRRT
jgi:predicted TIM-barrel fold metal-dependent hydrolase